MKKEDKVKVSPMKKMTLDEVDKKKSDRNTIQESIIKLKKGYGISLKKENMDRLISNVRTYIVQVKLRTKKEKREFITRTEFDKDRNPISILVYRTN